jgi:hypothetical protein
VDHWRLHDLLQGVDVLELGVWVALGVLVVDAGDLGEVLGLGAIPVGISLVNGSDIKNDM